jgi:formate-dependent nitrite reductase cytochrome c552 subunit
MPYQPGVNDAKYYGNGVGVKNRMQGNEYIQSTLAAHTKHLPDSTGSSCIECHMPRTGKHTGKSPTTVRTHVFRFIYPRESMQYGVNNSCNNCHQDKSLEWSEKTLIEWGMTSWEIH